MLKFMVNHEIFDKSFTENFYEILMLQNLMKFLHHYIVTGHR